MLGAKIDLSCLYNMIVSILVPSQARFLAREGFGLYDQVTKRTRWMPWRQKAMKDV